MRPGCEQARLDRERRREAQEKTISNVLMAACAIALALAVYWSLVPSA